MMHRAFVSSSWLTGYTMEHCAVAPASDGHLVGSAVRLRGKDIMLFAGYCRGGTGLAGGGEAGIFNAVEKYTNGGRRPFILLADFNDTPLEVSNSRWPERVKAAVVPPGAAPYTCTSGHKRVLDFAIASECLLPLITSIETVMDVPWAPHLGIRVVLKRDICRAVARTLVTPSTLLPSAGQEIEEVEVEKWEDSVAWAAQQKDVPFVDGLAKWMSSLPAQVTQNWSENSGEELLCLIVQPTYQAESG